MHDLTKQSVAAAGMSMPTKSVVMKSTGAFIFFSSFANKGGRAGPLGLSEAEY